MYTQSSSPHSCYIHFPSHAPWLDHSNYTESAAGGIKQQLLSKRAQTLIYTNILLTLNKLNLYKQILILILTIITPLKTNIFQYYISLKVHCKSKSKYNPNPTWFFTRLHDPLHSSGPSRRHVQSTQTASLPEFLYKHYSAHITIFEESRSIWEAHTIAEALHQHIRRP
jgi:hypothetical protein